ncbi:MAG: hypothetical protein IJ813_03195 [Bacteroidales bacterium]|nr:hypothetical protein [Bacteroidales bacterium]
MKTRFFILIAALCLACSCGTKVEPELFSVVEVNLATEDGEPVVSMTVSPSLEGNQFKNLNTGINYSFPQFQNSHCTMRVQKGVYVIGFDGVASLPGGVRRRVRHYSHIDPVNAVNLLDASETITLDLIYLD